MYCVVFFEGVVVVDDEGEIMGVEFGVGVGSVGVGVVGWGENDVCLDIGFCLC